MIDTRQLIASTAGQYGGDLAAFGFDPTALALATAKDESGFDPRAVGDQGHSIGAFQENDQGAGAGLSLEQRQDPVAQTMRYLQRVRDVVFAGFRGSPGEIAAAAQRPADPIGYARTVNTYYSEFAGTGVLGNTPPPPTPTPTPPKPGFEPTFPGLTYNPATGQYEASAVTPYDPVALAGGAIGTAVRSAITPIAIIGVVVLLGYMGLKEIAG